MQEMRDGTARDRNPVVRDLATACGWSISTKLQDS